ncbi:MAG TPA: DUF1833 family protein [Patescibacteria group bacterium]|nr:DUF1833 family protein [Patescibacteria group bacterium]
MSRNPSLTARAALNAPGTGEVFLVLLTLTHPAMAAPIRVTSDAVATVSRGNSFEPFPFALTLPDDAENAAPEARLRIDNIDRRVVAALRGLDSAPYIMIEIVRAAEPDVIEAKFEDFRLTGVTYDSQVVSGTLGVEDFTAEPFPAAIFSPGGFPGLF